MTSHPGHTMATLAERVPGAELLGSPEHRVRRLVHPAEAEGPGDLALVLTLEALALLPGDGACALLDRKLVDDDPALAGRISHGLVVARPRYALARISQCFPRRPQPEPGIHPSAVIASDAYVADSCHIGPHVIVESGAHIGKGTAILGNAYIGEEAVIGADCLLYPGVYVGDRVEIGDRAYIHPNAIIGGDSFAFDIPTTNTTEKARRAESHTGSGNDSFERIESLGTVRIDDDVEIGAATTIDRATLGATVIGQGTKLDNLVQVGHGTVIGRQALICSQVGVAGSCHVGDGVVLAGKVGVVDHRTIGGDSVVMARSAVIRDVPAGKVYYGMPARPVRETLRGYSLIGKLDEMRKRIAALEKRLGESPGDGESP